jgi:hypothetical protein
LPDRDVTLDKNQKTLDFIGSRWQARHSTLGALASQ